MANAMNVPLQIGQKVWCPPGLGHDGYYGTVISISPDTAIDMKGNPYQLVTLDRLGNDEPSVRAVFPSHRLSLS